jgi:putative transcriptional regulator
MKPKLFAELLGAMHDVVEHAQGKRNLRTTRLPEAPTAMSPVEVRELRDKLQASQGVFAHYLNVSTKLVQAWEAGLRTPSGPALVLLRIAERQPRFLDALYTDVNPAIGRRDVSRLPAIGKARMKKVAESTRQPYKGRR